MVIVKNSRKIDLFADLENKIKSGIKSFNEIRSPEAKAKLLEFKGKKFFVKFFGHMCFTCGTYDYFDDLKFELENFKINCKIRNFKNFGDCYVVEYKIIN